jgi:hypothetical protein
MSLSYKGKVKRKSKSIGLARKGRQEEKRRGHKENIKRHTSINEYRHAKPQRRKEKIRYRSITELENEI